MSDPEPYAHSLSRTLLHAYYWVDDGLQNYMQAHAGFSLPRAQSMLMICIGDGVHQQSKMAEVLQVSKQAVQQGVRELVGKGLVEVVPDPESGRRKIVRFTRRGSEMREVARRGVLELEARLAERIGRERVGALHEILGVAWGAPLEFNSGPSLDSRH